METDQMFIVFQKYEKHYLEVSQNMIHEPVQERRCTDFGCIFVFLIIVVAFFGIGVHQISQYHKLPSLPLLTVQGSPYVDSFNITNHLVIIGLGIGSAIITSYLYVLLVKMFPKFMVCSMIVFTIGLIVAVALTGLVAGYPNIAILMAVILLVYLLLLFCLKPKIEIGISMVKIASNFLSQKKLVFFIPIIKLLLTLPVVLFHTFSVSAMTAIIHHRKNQVPVGDFSKQIGFTILFTFFWLVFVYIFYYMMAYTISMVCANWYYGIQGHKGGLLNAYKQMFRQFGSIAYAAIIVSVVTFARMVVEGERNARRRRPMENNICRCILSCLLRAIQHLLKVLNHYSVIVFSITGQDYIEGAKTTIGLLWKQVGLMSASKIICNFLVLWGVIIAIGIPSVISYFMIRANTDSVIEQVVVVAIVAGCSFFISTVVFQVIVESVSCIFIYFCIDRNFMERGLIQSKRMTEETHEIVNKYSSNPYVMYDPMPTMTIARS